MSVSVGDRTRAGSSLANYINVSYCQFRKVVHVPI